MTGHIAHHSAKSLIFPLPLRDRSRSARRCPGTRRIRIADSVSANAATDEARANWRLTEHSVERTAMPAAARAY